MVKESELLLLRAPTTQQELEVLETLRQLNMSIETITPILCTEHGNHRLLRASTTYKGMPVIITLNLTDKIIEVSPYGKYGNTMGFKQDEIPEIPENLERYLPPKKV